MTKSQEMLARFAGQPYETRLLAATWMVKPLHREEFPLDGVVRLI
jgi:hypothetical protein